MRAAVVGASGFVGRSVTRAARLAGHEVTEVAAPRTHASQPSIDAVRAEVRSRQDVVSHVASAIEGCDVVVNAAGLAEAGSGDTGALVGANAVVPALLVEACRTAGVARLVHVSSAAVQGRREVLDETTAYDGFSPYAESKILGERALLESGWDGGVVYRPTSVHGPDRGVSQSLARLARSRASSVAGDGSRPTPQILATSVGSAVCFIVEAAAVPAVVMHPWEGMTTRALLVALGDGRGPRRIPTPLARGVVRALTGAATLRPGAQGIARRLEMLWLGQEQGDSWLTRAGWSGAATHDDWAALGRTLAQRP